MCFYQESNYYLEYLQINSCLKEVSSLVKCFFCNFKKLITVHANIPFYAKNQQEKTVFSSIDSKIKINKENSRIKYKL